MIVLRRQPPRCRGFPCGGGEGTPTSGVVMLPGCGLVGGGPPGTPGFGLWAAPQLGQKLVVSPISAPQFSQKRHGAFAGSEDRARQ